MFKKSLCEVEASNQGVFFKVVPGHPTSLCAPLPLDYMICNALSGDDGTVIKCCCSRPQCGAVPLLLHLHKRRAVVSVLQYSTLIHN